MTVADVSYATRDDADSAVRAACAAFPTWRDTPLADRATMLEKLADRLTADRFELAALQTFEVGKPWREADGDVAEAIDFCRYYARQALIELSPKPQGDVPGEDNVLLYEGRGPTVVIAPWNFPLAILTGMASAALAAGNPVILKPAEQSSAIAYQLYERMIAVGFAPGVVQFLPGDGAEVGEALVENPRIAQIAFTGSKQVGLRIVERAAKPHVDQQLLKRVVLRDGRQERDHRRRGCGPRRSRRRRAQERVRLCRAEVLGLLARRRRRQARTSRSSIAWSRRARD